METSEDWTFQLEEFGGKLDLRLDPLQVPEFHGGGSINKIPADSVYNRIAKRSALRDLPGVHSKDDAASFSSKAVQEAYMKIYHGDCHLECVHGNGSSIDVDGKKNGPLVNITVSVFHDDASNDSSCFSGSLVITLYNGAEKEGGTDRISFGNVKTPASRQFYRSLTMRQRQALSKRVLHLFFRTCGGCVTKMLRDSVYRFLQRHYLQGKYWKEYLDFCMIGADLSFNTTNGLDNRILTLVRFGEALEYVGKFQQAAEIYVEIIEKYWEGAQNKSPTNYSATQVHKFAAVAYTKAEDSQAAEKYFISALHYDLIRHGGSWSKPDESTAKLFGDFIAMYICAQTNEANEKAVWEVNASVELALGVLTCKAGIGPEDDCIQAYKDITDQLKPMYYKPKNAREALMSAVASKACSAQDFRSKLLMCCTKTGKSMIRQHNPKTTKSRRAADKESARKAAALVCPKYDDDSSKLKCSACGIWKESSELHWCPCKTVFYCQRECQLAHWKEHKKLCTNRKKNMAS